MLLAPLLLPDGGPTPTSPELTVDYGVAGYLCELLVTAESGLIGRSEEDSRLQEVGEADLMIPSQEGSGRL